MGKRVVRRQPERMEPWRHEALEAFLGQLPTGGLRRLRTELRAGRVCLCGFYACQRGGARQPGPLMAALPTAERERLLDMWAGGGTPQGAVAAALHAAWQRCGVEDLGARFHSDAWEGTTSEAVRDATSEDVLKVVDALLRQR